MVKNVRTENVRESVMTALREGRMVAVLDWVEDPVLAYDPEGELRMDEYAEFNRIVHEVLSEKQLIADARKLVQPLVEVDAGTRDCRACRLQDHFLVSDPDPRWVGVA